jgi:FlaA1/EpsC-like NDP-sugar epimerase
MMIRQFVLKHSEKFVSRWLILLGDTVLTLGLFLFAFVVRFNFVIDHVRSSFYLYQIPYVFIVFLVGFIIFQSYSGVIRYTTLQDSLKVFGAITFGSFVLALVTFYVQQHYVYHFLNIPFSVIVIHYLLCAFVLINSRFLIKMIYYQLITGSRVESRVLIFGAGNLGLITKNTLMQSNASKYKVVGFVDDDITKQRKVIEGIRVFSSLQVFRKKFIEKEKIDSLIIAINGLPPSRLRELTDKCLKYRLEIKTIPPVEKWFNGELSVTNINHVNIEDLLGRDEIVLDKQNIEEGIHAKTILITGAAGSIGSEIVRQVIKYKPGRIILFDQAETPMHDIFLETNHLYQDIVKEYIVGDVNNLDKLEAVFKKYQPHVIFHAAAYKHVPMMESNPYEAIKVNVLGTKNVADLAVKYKSQRFVMISTDKAVNPTNVMGASKRIAEMYTQSLNKNSGGCIFIITRFGNVLGSNGSVIPLFKKQIEAGGPVTVTHPEITRYFMTIPEACQLVLEAAFMGKEGEIYVFDMGDPVRIMDLAEKMIELSGFEPYNEIDIKITGLRPGEKIYEELLATKENTKPTHHDKIMIAQFNDLDNQKVLSVIDDFSKHLSCCDNFEIVKQMKLVVPEFLSNNSAYCVLDNELNKA